MNPSPSTVPAALRVLTTDMGPFSSIHVLPCRSGQALPAQTLLVKSRWLLSNAMGVSVTEAYMQFLWISNIVPFILGFRPPASDDPRFCNAAR
jgi:hypothetical protein